MNKQEAKLEVDKKAYDTSTLGRIIKLVDIKPIIDQIDDRPKVKIPQFVADWIEKCRAIKGVEMFLDFSETPFEIDDWLDTNKENYEIYMRAWLDGYEVDREKKYRVKSGHSYFSKFDEVMAIVVLDDMPGYGDYVKYFDSLKEAQKVAEQLGWEVEEVEV